MAEPDEEPEAEAQEALEQANPAAVAVALGKARAGAKLPPEAAAFLRRQTRLIELQTEHLHEQRELQLAHLRVRRWKDRLSLTLQSVGIAAGVAIVVGLGAMAWTAWNDDALVIEPFSAPPSFAQRGVGGDVVAADVMQRLDTMIRFVNTGSFSTSSNVSEELHDMVKVEIPETGISISEVWRLLRDWLGHERRVSGSLKEATDGQIVLTAQLAGHDPVTAKGAPGDLDRLEQEVAEKIYADFDPGNWVNYLDWFGRRAEAMAALERLPQTAQSNLQLAGIYSLWSNHVMDPRRSGELAQMALRIDPGLMTAHFEAMRVDRELGHDEDALAEARRLLTTKASDQPRQIQGQGVASARALARTGIALLTGDFAGASRERPPRLALAHAQDAARLHDLTLARSLLAQGATPAPPGPEALMLARYQIDAAAGDWPAAVTEVTVLIAVSEGKRAKASTADEQAGIDATEQVQYRPLLAEARARSGDTAGAAAAISQTPLDCYNCLRERGRVAAAQRDWASAERWFAEAVRQGPSLPFAYADWGEMLLAKGDVDGAIARLQHASRAGPGFADPLELWGEALMKKGDVGAAAGSFSRADKFAPHWGRNHLRWGEALSRLGRVDEAKAQWRAAAGAELSPADRAELARVQAHG